MRRDENNTMENTIVMFTVAMLTKSYWDLLLHVVREELDCRKEPTNAMDQYAVAIAKGGVVVLHLLVVTAWWRVGMEAKPWI